MSETLPVIRNVTPEGRAAATEAAFARGQTLTEYIRDWIESHVANAPAEINSGWWQVGRFGDLDDDTLCVSCDSPIGSLPWFALVGAAGRAPERIAGPFCSFCAESD